MQCNEEFNLLLFTELKSIFGQSTRRWWFGSKTMPDTNVGVQPKIASSNYSSLSDPVANVSATRPNFYLLLTQPPLPPQTPTLPRNLLRSHPNRHHHPNPQILHHRQPLVTLIMSNSFSPFLTLKSPGGIPPKKPKKHQEILCMIFKASENSFLQCNKIPLEKLLMLMMKSICDFLVQYFFFAFLFCSLTSYSS